MKRNLKLLVIGCSRFGAKIASKASTDGYFVTIVDKMEGSFVKLESSYSGYSIEGDATEIPVLKKARVDEVDEVVITTEDDDTNIFIASIIDHFFPTVSLIVIRLKDSSKSILLNGRKFKIISPNSLAYNEYVKVTEANL